MPDLDLDLVRQAITPETAAILIEPIQGEGGIRVVGRSFLQGLRQIADENGLLLILDEIQCGVGRTGKLFAHEWAGITPDIMGIAKGIGGGFPVGACLATEAASKAMTAGSHGSTFGGNPLAMAVGNAVLDIVLEKGFLEEVAEKGLYAKQQLAQLRDSYPDIIEEVRGDGLMLGLKCRVPNTELISAMVGEHILAVPGGDNVVRLLPPLIATTDEIREAVAGIGRAAAAAVAPRPRRPPRRAERHVEAQDRRRAQAFSRHRQAVACRAARDPRQCAPDQEGWPPAAGLLPPEGALRGGAGAHLREAVDAHARLLRPRHSRARRRGAVPVERGDPGRPPRDGRRHRPRALALCRCDPAAEPSRTRRSTELAEHATVPVINGLTNQSHPCQIMADLMTVEEHVGPIEKRKVAWIGDANNVANSWVHAAVRFGFELRIGCPMELAPAPALMSWVKKEKGKVEVMHDPAEAARGADCIVADTWVSIGDSDRERRVRLLEPYRVDAGAYEEGRQERDLHALPARPIAARR